jgi:hypothetical protein
LRDETNAAFVRSRWFAMVHIRDELEARLGRRVDAVRVREPMNPLVLARIERAEFLSEGEAA